MTQKLYLSIVLISVLALDTIAAIKGEPLIRGEGEFVIELTIIKIDNHIAGDQNNN